MKSREKPNTMHRVEKRLLSITEASAYIGLSKTTAYKYLKSIGAIRKIGRRSLFDKEVIDNEINKVQVGDISDETFF